MQITINRYRYGAYNWSIEKIFFEKAKMEIIGEEAANSNNLSVYSIASYNLEKIQKELGRREFPDYEKKWAIGVCKLVAYKWIAYLKSKITLKDLNEELESYGLAGIEKDSAFCELSNRKAKWPSAKIEIELYEGALLYKVPGGAKYSLSSQGWKEMLERVKIGSYNKDILNRYFYLREQAIEHAGIEKVKQAEIEYENSKTKSL